MSKSSITVSHHALRNKDVSGQVVVMCSKTFEKGFAHTEHRSNEVSGSVHNFTMNFDETDIWPKIWLKTISTAVVVLRQVYAF